MSESNDQTKLTPDEKVFFQKNMWPAKAVDNPKELAELLDEGFVGANFSAYCRKNGGYAWINALHDFHNNGQLDTPLTYMSQSGDDHRMLRKLLELGADPNLRNSKGENPLHAFLYHGAILRRLRFWDLLVENGANVFALYQGETVFDVVKDLKDKDQVSGAIYESLKGKFHEFH